MMEAVRAWLNGKRDYFTGVSIFKKFCSDDRLIRLLSAGENTYNKERLLEEIMIIWNKIKDEEERPEPVEIKILEIDITAAPPEITVENSNQLFEKAHREAMKIYKLCMNKRAVLFQLTEVEDWQEVNTAERIANRSRLAIEVVELFNQASSMFSIADYIKKYNRMPQDAALDTQDMFVNLPEALIKPTLDNARKALNKLKGKEPTSDRLKLMQKHLDNIKILENKWHSYNLQIVEESK